MASFMFTDLMWSLENGKQPKPQSWVKLSPKGDWLRGEKSVDGHALGGCDLQLQH